MNDNYSPMDEVKNKIRVFLQPVDQKERSEHFNFNREEKYHTTIDDGYEDLDMHYDLAKIMMYMNNDNILFSNGKRYIVQKRSFQPCVPVMLTLYVEEV